MYIFIFCLSVFVTIIGLTIYCHCKKKRNINKKPKKSSQKEKRSSISDDDSKEDEIKSSDNWKSLNKKNNFNIIIFTILNRIMASLY